MKISINELKVAQIVLNTISELTDRYGIQNQYARNSVVVRYHNQFVTANWVYEDSQNETYSAVRKSIIEKFPKTFLNRTAADVSLSDLVSDFKKLSNFTIEIAVNSNLDASSLHSKTVQFISENIKFEDYFFSDDSEFEFVSFSSSITTN